MPSEPLDERISRRLAEIGERERELTRREVERDAAARDLGAAVVRRERGFLRSFGFLAGVLVLAAGLFGVAVTLNRLSGEDMADARRSGQATVSSCVTRGPVTTRGFGSWDRCDAEIAWTDGGIERLTIGGVFTSADIGKPVRVGDLGDYRGSRKLARADQAVRPWLAWLGYGVGAIAMLPTLVGVLLLREVVRPRRR